MNHERDAPRVVMDTNILISALLSPHGAPFQCLALARVGRIVSVSCQEILQEFHEKLIQKFGYLPHDAERAVAEVKAFSEIVTLSGASCPELSDPSDWMVIECAVVGHADYIVSGDRHLLSLGDYRTVEILTARQLLQRLSGAREG